MSKRQRGSQAAPDDGAARVAGWPRLVVAALAPLLALAPAPACRLSELACASGRCVPLNRYCDAADDCGDASDEPRGCTPCNRTYYGDVGKTYELELHRPREDKLPFACQLTFAAGGGDLGDVVQLTFDSFTLGRFTSFTADGCPDGSMHISEADRPAVGGAWCGSSWGSALYYSETHSVSLALRLARLSRDHTGYNFDFRLGYKTLPRRAAVVRYGQELAADSKYHLGDLMPSTYCSRIFSDCDRKPCRLQSPNFPGFYPRNLTCYYAVRQHEVPPGKQALIAVGQRNGQLVAIRSQAALHAPAGNQQPRRRELKVWADCDDVQDHVTVYDGYTTRDPVLLKFCGGGEAVPEAVSSGPELLVEFSSSPYGTLLYPAPLQSLHGFQLDVQVRFVDQQSPTYARNKRCEFWVRGSGKGSLETPRHSLPPNTTCLYHLQGADVAADGGRPSEPRYRVWLAVLKFHVAAPAAGSQDCASQLLVWDGALRPPAPDCEHVFCEEGEKTRFPLPPIMATPPGRPPPNVTLLARYCKDQVPRSCDHSLLANSSRHPRPCSLTESYLSSGDSLTLELRLAQSTALRPVAFRALYEFVDLHQDGEPFGEGKCSRRFAGRPQSSAAPAAPAAPTGFQAPRDVFLYGRGGAVNLSCTYRWEAGRGQVVQLALWRLLTGGRRCEQGEGQLPGRLQCPRGALVSLQLAERPWEDVAPLPADCLCSGAPPLLPFNYTSTARVLELSFQVVGGIFAFDEAYNPETKLFQTMAAIRVTGMNASDDFRRLNFQGSWQFVPAAPCSRRQRLSGASGEILLRYPSRAAEEERCERHPWLIEAAPARHLYVKLRGVALDGNSSGEGCDTSNRISLRSGSSVHVVVCPRPRPALRHHVVEVFSEGWAPAPGAPRRRASGVSVEFLASEPGFYSLSWLELARRRPVLPPGSFVMADCEQRCPELDACINSSLWCDGVPHCPSGYDEAAQHCSWLLRQPALHLALAAALLLLLLLLCCAALASCRACARRRRVKSLAPAVGKEVIC